MGLTVVCVTRVAAGTEREIGPVTMTGRLKVSVAVDPVKVIVHATPWATG